MDPISHSTVDVGHSNDPASIALSRITTKPLGASVASRGTNGADSKAFKTREYIQFVALCWSIYLGGWSDGTNGPLLPRMQRVYGVDYAVVSLIFVLACMGFITGALANIFLDEKLGFGKVIVMGSFLQVVASSIASSAPPFPVFVFASFVNGVGLALQNSQSLGYVASLKENAAIKMGIFSTVYGGGSFSSPLVATQFSQLDHWSFHYLISIGMALINTVALIVVFRLERKEECLAKIGISLEQKQASEHSHLRQIVTLKEVHLLALFTSLYAGAEVTTGGWIVSYIIKVRGGGPSSGYISAGYFGGLTVGRVALLWVNEKVGERLVLFVYAICAIGVEFVVWFVPSLVGDAVAVAIIGLLMGPMYPISMNHCGRILPPWLLTGAIGWVTGSAQAGSAIMPFIAGAIASKAGIATLQPLLVGILSLMTISWAFVPSRPQNQQ